MSDLSRLGKRNSYRLGQLRVQGAGPAGPPPLRRPRFRRRHRGPASLWLLAAAASVAVIAAGAAAGLWYAPFAVGLAAGLVSRIGGWRARVLAAALAAVAMAGWGIALWWPALHGQRAGGTAPVIAALAAWPGSAAGGVLLALVVAVVQALAGLGLGRALTSPAPAPPAETLAPQGADLGPEDAGLADAEPAATGAAAAGSVAAGPGAGSVADLSAVTGSVAAGPVAAAATAESPGAGAVEARGRDLDGGSGRQSGPAGPTMGG